MMHELQKLVAAVENLSRIKGGRTLFEHSPTNDEECANAWLALNAAMCEAKAVLSAPNALAKGPASAGPA